MLPTNQIVLAPADIEAENAVIGSIIMDPAASERILLSVGSIITKPEMFYLEANRHLWRAIRALQAASTPIDFRTVQSCLIDSKVFDCVGQEHMVKCLDCVATNVNAEYYAISVARKYHEREIISLCRGMADRPSIDIIEPIREHVLARDNPGVSDDTTINEVVHRMMSEDKAKDRKSYRTGYQCLDSVWLGSHPGEVNVIAARPCGGKSLFLQNLMLMASKNGYPSIYFGTEMSNREVSKRLVSINGGIAARSVRVGNDMVANDDILTSCDEIAKLPMRLVDDPQPDLAKVERYVSSCDCDIVYLDYLEQFRFPKAENYRLSIGAFMKDLKALARRLNVLVFLAAQLNRNSYKDDDTRPTMANLAEAAAIERVADRVVVLWVPGKDMSQARDGNRICLELIQAKNRHGKWGMIDNMEISTDNLRITEARKIEPSDE